MRLRKVKEVDPEQVKNIPLHGFYYAVCRTMGFKSRASQQNWPRITSSFACFFLSTALIFFYYWPDEFVRSPAGKEQRPGSLIVFIQTLTDLPIWSIAFAFASIFLLFVIFLRHETMPWAHFVNSMVMFFYAGAIWYGAFVAEGTYVVTAAFATFASVINFSMAISYAERPLE